MTGFCYAMLSGETVKIGWSSAPALRVSKVRSDTPADVRLVGFVESTAEQEREIHGLLAPWRVFGEWFRLEGAVVAFVDALRGRGIARSGTTGVVAGRNPIAAAAYSKGLNLSGVASLMGVHKTAMTRWAKGRIPAHRVLEVERITGIPRHELRPDIYPLPTHVPSLAGACA